MLVERVAEVNHVSERGVFVEILAPAGSAESLKMAIANGANAVYLGVDRFSARAKATAFTLSNLKEWVLYAHARGVKVYLTVNTLIKSSEMEEAVSVCLESYCNGIDAIILQDLGLFHILHSIMPDIILHASTQMGISNHLSAEFALENGAARVVLSRECGVQEIRAVKNTGIEVEHFVHGALCVSFSGNCYYSSLVSGCSGNRGKCLQLCRKVYDAEVDGNVVKRGYLLSPKDQCLLRYVGEMNELGVDSLKIEGRMKRPEYAGEVSNVYCRSQRGKSESIDRFRLESIYNRGGFSEGYFHASKAAHPIIWDKTQGHIGAVVGKVIQLKSGKIMVNTQYHSDVEDGFKILRNGLEVGYAFRPVLEKAGFQALYKGDVRIGDDVCVTTDSTQLKAVSARKKDVLISFHYVLKIGQKAMLMASCEDVIVHVFSDFVVQQAKNSPTKETEVIENAEKLQATGYCLESVTVDADHNIFVVKSALNDLRRRATEAMNEKTAKIFDNMLANRRLKSEMDISTRIGSVLQGGTSDFRRMEKIPTIVLQSDKQEDIALLDDCSDRDQVIAFIYSPADYSKLQHRARLDARVYLNLPMLALEKDLKLLHSQAEVIKEYDGIVAHNLYAVEFAKKLGMRCAAGYGLNVSNPYHGLQVDFVIGSVENIAEASSETIVFGFGKFPLMTVAHCPYAHVFGYSCADCRYHSGMRYRDDKGKCLSVERIKLDRCYFSLNDLLELPAPSRKGRMFIDLRGFESEEKKNILHRFLSGETILTSKNYFPASFQ